jgi:death-on-curing protein
VSEPPVWVDKRALLLLHKESLAQFGGADGLRDEELLDSALARPVNKHLHEGCNDLSALAAAYGFGLARNHPFVDGNKRAAFLAVGVFLAMNGQRLTATPVEAIEAILTLAAGSLDEVRFADWIKAHVRATADCAGA